MIHQPMGGTQGQASDIEIQAKELLRLKKELNRILAEKTGKPEEKVAKDSERDFYMSAEEAQLYGLIDRVVSKPVSN
jgi:ATP-dependent Clp protease protease subunit